MDYSANWAYHNPVQVIFGPDSIKKLPSLLSSRKGLLVTSPGFTARGLTGSLRSLLDGHQLEILDQVQPNPDIQVLESHRQRLCGKGLQFIIGVGGGSVLDTAKILSFLLNITREDFSLKAHFEEKVPLPKLDPLPVIAVPTTAGTGSEVTPFATVWDNESQKKYSLAAPNLYPAIALLDPALSLNLPAEITTYTGLDALSHAFESIWNRNANPITVNSAVQAIDLIFSTLPALLKEPRNLRYRSKMLTASLLGGLCISATRTALAHSISYPITICLGAPHGLACGFTLPEILEFNAKADDGRLSTAVRMLGLNDVKTVKSRLVHLFEEIGVKDLLSKYRLSREQLLDLAPQMFTPGRVDNNLRAVNLEDISNIIVLSC